MLDVVADESVNYRFVKRLREEGFNVYSIMEECSGITDREVLQIAKDRQAVLITEDSDFGEWVFAHHEKGLHVIYLRYTPSDEAVIYQSMEHSLKQLTVEEKYFIVITPRKIRKRAL